MKGKLIKAVAGLASGVVVDIMKEKVNSQKSNSLDNSSSLSNVAPPPIKTKVYNIAVSGQATGPYDIQTIQQLAFNGQFSSDSLVWTSGMTEWAKADTVDELRQILTGIMPPIPKTE